MSQTVGFVRELLLLVIDLLGFLLILAICISWLLLSIRIVSCLLLKAAFLFFGHIVAVKKFSIYFRLANAMAHRTTVAGRDRHSLFTRLYDLILA